MLSRLIVLLTCLLTFSALAAEPLEPDLAYKFSARALDEKTIEARWDIAEGYYLYRHKLAFRADGAQLGAPQLPPGKEKNDDFFGKVETYRGTLNVRIPVISGGGAIVLYADSQGCWDEGVCYPPMTQQARITLASAGASSAPAASTDAPTPPAPAGDESGRIAQLIKTSSLWVIVASFFGFGLLLALTPCVFPMIPILSGIIVNHGHAISHGRAFTLSSAYVLGMALTYAAVGVAAGFSGALLSQALQNAWALGAFALVFVALALSMFGFYELQMPAAWQTRLSSTANRQGGSLPAIALMGALSALIVGPCVAAPLAGALLYIAQTGDAWLGGVALFAMGLGMGAPLIVVGVFSRSFLPKPGDWMEGVKKFFGVVMLATALWLVSPVLPAWAIMLGWALLFIIPAIYLSALDPLPPAATGWRRFWKGVGLAMLLYGAALLIGLLGGHRDPLQPLGFLRGAAAQPVSAVPPAPSFTRIGSSAELDARLANTQKPVLLDFYADWCVSCKEMEKYTFADPAVAAKLAEFTLLQADVTAHGAEERALLSRFGLFGPPGIIFFDRAGRERPALKVVGFQPAEQFLQTLERALQP
jgi:thiol:disulfide interchange protein DsbD